jgi:hypothetical protein
MTVDIPEDELREVMRWTGAKTGREAVLEAITDFSRRRRLERLADQLGAFEEVMTVEELLRSRRARG